MMQLDTPREGGRRAYEVTAAAREETLSTPAGQWDLDVSVGIPLGLFCVFTRMQCVCGELERFVSTLLRLQTC